MSVTSEHILHTAYKFKVGDRYFTLYFESSGDDVIIKSDIDGLSEADGTTLTEVLKNLKKVLDTYGKKTVVSYSNLLETTNPILLEAQLAIELDTFRMKVGDGVTPYNQLEPFLTKEIPSENVIVPKGIIEITSTEKKDLTTVLKSIVNMLNSSFPIYMSSSEFFTKNPKLNNGQLGIESNTGFVKIGDADTKYNDLEYFSFKHPTFDKENKDPILASSIILTSVNPVIADLQTVYETDSGKFKIGDGFTSYNDLPYVDTSVRYYSCHVPLCKTHGFLLDNNPILAKNRLVIETDTFKYKVSDGKTNYNSLSYTDNAINDSGFADPSSYIVDSYENLLDDDPVLEYGQVAVTEDGSRLVIGDGVSRYSDLTPTPLTDDLSVTKSAADFRTENYTYPRGIILIESDTGSYKIADGVNYYTNLKYATNSKIFIGPDNITNTSLILDIDGNDVEIAFTEITTDTTAPVHFIEDHSLDGRNITVEPSTVDILETDETSGTEYEAVKAVDGDGTTFDTIELHIIGSL